MPTVTLPSGTWSYDASARTDLNRVRELIGDTNHQDAKWNRLVANEVITEALTASGNDVPRAALHCIDLRLAAVAMEADVGQRAAGLDTSRRFERMLQLRREAIVALVGGTTAPEAPYLSIATRAANAADTDNPFGVAGNPGVAIGSLDGDM